MFIHDAGPKALVEYLHLSESVLAKCRLQELTYTWNGRRFSFEVQFSRLSSLVIHRNGHFSRDFLASPRSEAKNDSKLPCSEEPKAAEPLPLSETNDFGRESTPGRRDLPGFCEEDSRKQCCPNEMNELSRRNESNFGRNCPTMNMPSVLNDCNDCNDCYDCYDLNNMNDLSKMNSVNGLNNLNSLSGSNSLIDPIHPIHPMHPVHPIHPIHPIRPYSSLCPPPPPSSSSSAPSSRAQSEMNPGLAWNEMGMEQGAGYLRRIIIDGFVRRVPMRYVLEFLPGILVVEARFIEGVHGFSLWIIGRMWWSDMRLIAFFETHPLDGMILFLRESSFLCDY